MGNTIDYMEVVKLMRRLTSEPLPERWAKDEDMNPTYMGGFLTAYTYFGKEVKEKIAEALHQIHEGKEGNAIQILNHLFDKL